MESEVKDKPKEEWKEVGLVVDWSENL